MSTQVDKAMDFIKAKSSARSDAIAEHLGIKLAQVAVILNAPCKDGRLVSCKVERPGKPAINEYRIGGGMRPAEFTFIAAGKRGRPAAIETKPATAETKAAPPAPPAPKAETKTPERETPPPAAARSTHHAQELAVAITHLGQMTITFDHLDIQLTPALTRRLGEFFSATDTVWS